MINLAWGSGSVPTDWQKALIVPVHKKGSRTQCKNYCGISLLSIPSQVYASVLETRMRTITEWKVWKSRVHFSEMKKLHGQVVHCQVVTREHF